MDKKEIATYIIVDSANFIKRTVKKTFFTSLNITIYVLGFVFSVLYIDHSMHKDIYQQYNIHAQDLLKSNNRFMITSSIQNQTRYLEDNIEKQNLNLSSSYVPITQEFQKSTYNYVNYDELKTLNSTLAQQYENICNTGIISTLICLKYNKKEEINKLKT